MKTAFLDGKIDFYYYLRQDKNIFSIKIDIILFQQENLVKKLLNYNYVIVITLNVFESY